MKRLLNLAGLALAAILGSFALSAPAHAVPTCTAYTDSTASYPADSAGHEQICFAATTTDKTTIATAVRALPRKGSSGPLQAYDQIASAGVKIFFFNNSADAASYLQNTAPYNSYPPYATAANNGHCGFTASLADGSGLITGIYKTCNYNASITPATGFDIVMGVIQGTVPSAKNGFSVSQNPQNYLLDGLNKLTPSDWNTKTAQQKNDFVCNMFSTIQFSPLERALIIEAGGTDPGAGASVCVTNGSTMTVTSTYSGKTPTQIANMIAPYFISKSNEAWAEIFARNVGVTTPPAPGFLQLTDRLFITPRYDCANLDVSKYSTTSLPPTQTDINNHSCSFTPNDL
jgi:hypothetical protein